MSDPEQKRDPPGIGAMVAVFCAVVTTAWFYLQLRVWREEGHDHMLTALNICVTILLWMALCYAFYRNLKDARRAKSLQAQIVTIKDDFKTQTEASTLAPSGPPSPKELRGQVLGLAGDLCAFLMSHDEELDPEPIDNPNGFDDAPDNPEIRSEFPSRFSTRISDVKDRLGNLSLLSEKADFSSIGDVLATQVRNAGDVRSIICALDSAKRAIDEKCLRGTPFQFYNSAPAKHAIGVQPAALFTPLQVEAFRLAKRIRNLIDEVGRYPDKENFGYKDGTPGNTEQIHRYHAARREIDRIITFRYRERLADETEKLLLRAGGDGYPIHSTDWHSNIVNKDGFEKLAADLEMVALWFNRKDRTLEEKAVNPS
jgi:hypothetical protein